MANSQPLVTTHPRNRSDARPVDVHYHDFSRVYVWLYVGQRQMKGISEASFMSQVKALAYQYGWSLHHAQPSMTRTGRYITTGSPGFPDIVMAHPRGGLIFAELKTEIGKLSYAQMNWRAMLVPHAECYVWRPRDLQTIAERLAAR